MFHATIPARQRYLLALAGLALSFPLTMPRAASASGPQARLEDGITLSGLGSGSTLVDVDYLSDVPVTATVDACWLTVAEYSHPTTCTQHSGGIKPKDKPRTILTFTYRQKAQANQKQPSEKEIEEKQGAPGVLQWPAAELDPSKLAYFRLRYDPDDSSRKSSGDILVLRLEWKANNTEVVRHYIVAASVPGEDENRRYFLNLYGGAAYLYSAQNFGQSFPEVQVAVETRFVEDFLAKRPAFTFGKHMAYWSVRGYAEAGLTSTSVATGATDAGSSTLSAVTGSKAFVGSVALGAGFNIPVAPFTCHPALTCRFSFQALARLSVTSIPIENTALTGTLPTGTLFGVRIQNENGHFRGAYLETGFGQSDSFVYQRSARWKTDTFIPFTDSGVARLALRVIVDRPSFIFANLNDDFEVTKVDAQGKTIVVTSKEESHRLIRGGEIKISLLVNVDIRDLFHLLGGATSVK